MYGLTLRSNTVQVFQRIPTTAIKMQPANQMKYFKGELARIPHAQLALICCWYCLHSPSRCSPRLSVSRRNGMFMKLSVHDPDELRQLLSRSQITSFMNLGNLIDRKTWKVINYLTRSLKENNLQTVLQFIKLFTVHVVSKNVFFLQYFKNPYVSQYSKFYQSNNNQWFLHFLYSLYSVVQ